MKNSILTFWGGSNPVLMAGLVLALAGPCPGDAKAAATTPLGFVVGSAGGTPGDQVLVPIQVTGFSDISTFQFSLHWTRANAMFMDMEQFGIPGLAGASFGLTQTNSGTVTVSWDDLGGVGQSMADGTSVFVMRFLLVGTSSSVSSLAIDDQPTPVEVSTTDGQLVTPGLTAGQLTVTLPNTPPLLPAIGNKTVSEGSLLTFTATATDSDLPPQTLTYTLGAGAPVGAALDSATGVFTWIPPKAPASRTNVISVIVSDNGLPGLSATQSFTVTVLKTNSAPVFMPLSGYLAQVLIPLRVTNVVSDPDLPPNRVTFEIVDAPKGTRINKYSGVVTWAPTRSQARSTNWLMVSATDDGTPPLSVTNTFQVKVDDYLELSLGRTVVLAGQSGSIPITVTNTTGVTNLSTSLFVATDRLANLGISSLAPELDSGTLQPRGPGVSKMEFNTSAGQILQAGQLLAQLNFTAVSTQSAFVPLVISNLTSIQSNGFALTRTLAGAGRVVVVGSEPLVEALTSTNLQAMLVLYGLPGTNYLVESTIDSPSPSNSWQTAWQGRLTNLFQLIQPAGAANRIMFFRARQQ